MKMVAYGSPEANPWLDRQPAFDSALTTGVSKLLAEVKSDGESAVLRHSRDFDAPGLESVWVSKEELESAQVPDEQLDAIRFSIERVRDFHETQLGVVTHDWEKLDFGYGWRTDATEVDDTGFEGQRMLPVASVGIYVPGGQASYPSSVIMNVVPAQVAGVQRIVVATPASQDGRIADAVLVACRELGITEILKAGGASAIGALAFGWPGFDRVDKIAGPGNKYVSEAKRQLWGTVGLDSFAGPSEVAVYVDETSQTKLAALDLLAQVEHAPDNVGVLIATSRMVADRILGDVSYLLRDHPREDVMRTALERHGVCLLVENDDQAVEAINRIAPEHLSLHNERATEVAMSVVNCGCVLIGPMTAQSCGDFVSGPSHTLPTSGAARFDSPVNVQTFLKFQSISMFTREDAEYLAETVGVFATMEGLPMHGHCATGRIEE
ncbi:histidinol dehydrogenase [Kamptonema cortianum]|nr:histidinol dehydrogenase [Geitlerinema splendidum]MDK3158594.1 histidinol dehydrogenase [Kamptonema cortianum]